MNHDEYTDYSCSTSVERLSRDVETLMRSWHLVGSDRHVSFSHSSSFDNLLRTKSGGGMPNLKDALGSGIGRSKSSSMLSVSAGIAREEGGEAALQRRHSSKTASGNPSNAAKKQLDAVRLIRSSEVTFTLSLSRGGRVSIPLTLALWDGPSCGDVKDMGDDLPHSLRRTPFAEFPDRGAFSNFSFLFGIGQHMTLTPTTMDEQITEALHVSMTKRHASSTSPWATVSALSTMLQTALNCAVSSCQCRIPVFGLWGTYQPQSPRVGIEFKHEFFPEWITQSPVPTLYKKKLLFKKKRKQSLRHLNRQACVSPLAASLMPGARVDAPGATFWASVLNCKNGRLNEWGRLLLQHLPQPEKTVALWGARHVYAWWKPRRKERTSILFDNGDDETYRQWRPAFPEKVEPTEDVETYRAQCRHHAQTLLEQATGATPDEPIWGCADDPLASVHVTVTWNGRKSVTWNGRKTEDSVEPLLLLPLRIRSRHAVSGRDLQDMEDAMEGATLNPFQLSANFVVQPTYDRETSLTSLAASQRCVLAALIRTASLHPDTLLQHVTNEAVLDEWSESDFDVPALEWIMNHSKVGPLTKRFVDAMSWMDVADHMIEYEEAQHIVQQVLDQTSTLSFPSPPEGAFASHVDPTDEWFSPLLKSAPYGRLVSILFLHMARLRSPSSMSLVWLAFVTELRNRWYSRESLPNMGLVPGLDPHPDESTEKRVFSSIGTKAAHAAFVHCSEPDPDDYHCLIGQKLQVFNICVESTTALELLEMERLERKHAEQQNEPHPDELSDVEEGSDHACVAPSVASTEVMNNQTPMMNSTLMSDTASADADDAGESFARRHDSELAGFGIDGQRGPIVDATPPKGFMGSIEEGHESSASTSTKQEYCDAREGRSIVSSIDFDNGFDDAARGRDDTTNVTQRQNRKGARCPVHGVSLVASGDQLYAPYLQRPNPLTDNTVMEYRLMLARQRRTGGSTNHSSDGKRRVQDRVELAHRLQKPKLLSDMRAFKAANPGAVFQDFINWYGNPGNPLDECKDVDEAEIGSTNEVSSMSAAMKLDRASEAIQILNATRDFWSDTWDEATPCAAIEQEPLFDVFKTVEMLLHHLETLHPASLVNQVMAVNLSMSYFVLVTSAGDALQVGAVKSSLRQFREKTNSALELLARDATDGAYPLLNDRPDFGRLPKHASSVAIALCEGVCDELAETEALLARATTLLHKFPKQYDLVQTMLRRADGDSISLDSEEGRRGILSIIKDQQDHISVGADLPIPCLREYVLRNRDDANPCQLCVRFGDKRVSVGNKSDGGVLLTLTKCCRN